MAVTFTQIAEAVHNMLPNPNHHDKITFKGKDYTFLKGKQWEEAYNPNQQILLSNNNKETMDKYKELLQPNMNQDTPNSPNTAASLGYPGVSSNYIQIQPPTLTAEKEQRLKYLLEVVNAIKLTQVAKTYLPQYIEEINKIMGIPYPWQQTQTQYIPNPYPTGVGNGVSAKIPSSWAIGASTAPAPNYQALSPTPSENPWSTQAGYGTIGKTSIKTTQEHEEDIKKINKYYDLNNKNKGILNKPLYIDEIDGGDTAEDSPF